MTAPSIQGTKTVLHPVVETVTNSDGNGVRLIQDR
jgi:hypothetical protein